MILAFIGSACKQKNLEKNLMLSFGLTFTMTNVSSVLLRTVSSPSSSVNFMEHFLIFITVCRAIV
jgi:hypothetical protein